MPKVNVAIVVGSNRRQSINRKLARALAKLADGKLAVSFVQIDDLPMYNQDLEDPAAGERRAASRPRSSGPMRCCSSRRSTIAPFPPSSRTRSIGARGPTAGTHGRESLRRSPAPRPARSRARSPSSICARFWATQAPVVMGGEAYITFKPGLIDEPDPSPTTGTRAFLQSFVDQFAALVARLERERQHRARRLRRPLRQLQT